MQQELKSRQKALDDRAAAILCLQLIFVVQACQDLGPAIAAKLVLPALSDRLHDKARQFNAAQASPAKGDAHHAEVDLPRTASHSSLILHLEVCLALASDMLILLKTARSSWCIALEMAIAPAFRILEQEKGTEEPVLKALFQHCSFVRLPETHCGD